MAQGQIFRANASDQPAWSTATYPDTAGTSGNVMTSDGTNWVSSANTAGAGLLSVSGTLTNTQVKNLRATPVQIVAAPGAGNIIQVVTWSMTMNYGGTNAFTAPSSALVNLFIGASVVAADGLYGTALTSTTSRYAQGVAFDLGVLAGFAYSSLANAALNIGNNGGAEIAGNAANNNTVSYNVLYRIITIP